MTKHRCAHCLTPVLSTVDNDVAGLPILLQPYPVERLTALRWIAAGRRAVIREDDRRSHRAHYYALSAGRIPNRRLAAAAHYVEHICGETPDPLPPAPTAALHDREAPY